MIVVKIIGGLGNQMFQYALYRSLKEKGKEAKIDISSFLSYELHNGYELRNVFNIDEDLATEKDIGLLADFKKDFSSKFRRKLFGRKNTHFVQEEFKFIPEVFEMDHVYLDGFWQSEKYFLDIEEMIRRDFDFKIELDGPNKDAIEKMNRTNSVSLHVRRGDYISNPEAFKVHGGITTLEYYNKAIEQIKESVENPAFFIFSDDINWVKENMNLGDSYYIDWNKGKNSYKDMQLMSYCKHNIIANSSFSWWGAWLNRNKSKIVITPNKWFNTMKAEDIIPKDWRKIEVK